jgi:hypothetical protein
MKATSLLFCALALSGCATYLAPPDEYALYRRTRVEPTFDARIAAAHRYLKEHPDGAFAPEVKSYFKRAEPVYYAAKHGSIAGLEAYLGALAGAPHDREARQELGRLRSTRDAKATELTGAAEATADKLDREARDRARVRAEVTGWIERFLDARAFAEPLIEAPVDRLAPWSLALPWPVCHLEGEGPRYRCAKVISLPYVVIVDGVRDAREATVEIAVRYDARGVPASVTVGGPQLFARLEETRAPTSSGASDDPERAVEAIAAAVSLVKSTFEDHVAKDAACAHAVTAPTVLDLACHGLRVVVRAGQGEDDDRVEITAAAKAQ